ncbi:MAG: PKD domain-containing protein [Bacteroidia bacterium]|nr:PKD domain-containing protein [Bacteroidia bacterium]
MKTSIKISSLIILVILSVFGKAQIQVSYVCVDQYTLFALNNQGLSNPTYSANPGGLTSSNPTFVVTCTTTTSYTLYTTGTDSNSAVVTTSVIVPVIVGTISYDISSPQSFTLGCAQKSVCAINILNGQGMFGGAASYSLLPPGSSSITSSGTLSGQTAYTVNAPGTWTVAVRDNVSFCTSYYPINITQNITPPPVGTISISQNPLTCFTPTALLDAGTLPPNLDATWHFPYSPGSIASSSMAVNSLSASPNTSVVGNFTLVLTDIVNACKSNTSITVYQNIYRPNANILVNSLPPGTCPATIVLTNASSTGIPPGTYSSSQPVVANLWEGPLQNPATFVSSYLAYIPGQYTMTVTDMNNGCTKSVTTNFTGGISAAFTHTVTNGQVAFSNTSANTSAITGFLWDFGDGTFTTQQNPTHTYSNAGSYIVKLKIINSFKGCSDSVMQAIAVSGIPCTANSGFTMAPSGIAQVWNASPLYPWNISNATWDWGDGSSSNILYTSHTYSAAGLYSICLSVTVNCAASSSSCSTYSVYKLTQEALMLKVNVVEPALIETGIEDNGNVISSWSILPNPNEGEFKLTYNIQSAEKVKMIVFDLTGRTVHEQYIETDLNSVDIHTNNLIPGIYLITIESEGVKYNKRMVINH